MCHDPFSPAFAVCGNVFHSDSVSCRAFAPSAYTHCRVCGSVLQHSVVCCTVRHCVAMYLLTPHARTAECDAVRSIAVQCMVGCCSVLQCAAVCCSVLQCVAVCCSVLQCVAACFNVLQRVAVYSLAPHIRTAECGAVRGRVYCSVVQSIVEYCSVFQYVW